MLERIQTLAGSLVTWLTLALAVVATASTEVAEVVGADHDIARWLVSAVAWLGVAITVVRSVSPAAPEERGLTRP